MGLEGRWIKGGGKGAGNEGSAGGFGDGGEPI